MTLSAGHVTVWRWRVHELECGSWSSFVVCDIELPQLECVTAQLHTTTCDVVQDRLCNDDLRKKYCRVIKFGIYRYIYIYFSKTDIVLDGTRSNCCRSPCHLYIVVYRLHFQIHCVLEEPNLQYGMT
ncbi:hypothetical protein ACOSQ3_010766 [Xanthoceras sorbifolium]